MQGDEPAGREARARRRSATRPSAAGPSRHRGSSPAARMRRAASAIRSSRAHGQRGRAVERSTWLSASAASMDVEMRVRPVPGIASSPGSSSIRWVCGSARDSRSTAEPANAILPSRIPTASTQPNPEGPANVAIRPVTRVSSGISRSRRGAASEAAAPAGRIGEQARRASRIQTRAQPERERDPGLRAAEMARQQRAGADPRRAAAGKRIAGARGARRGSRRQHHGAAPLHRRGRGVEEPRGRVPGAGRLDDDPGRPHARRPPRAATRPSRRGRSRPATPSAARSASTCRRAPRERVTTTGRPRPARVARRSGIGRCRAPMHASWSRRRPG